MAMWQKFYLNFSQAPRDAVRALDPVACVLFLLAFFGLRNEPPRWRRLFKLVVWAMFAVLTLSSLMTPDVSLWAVWAPVVCIVGAARFTDWMRRQAESAPVQPAGDATVQTQAPSVQTAQADSQTGLDENGAAVKKRKKFRFSLGSLSLKSRTGRAAAYAAVVVFSSLQLINYVKAPVTARSAQMILELTKPLKSLPAEAVVMSDNPALVAWYGGRRALMLPRDEKDLDLIENIAGPLGAIYITANLRETIELEKTRWWVWINSPIGVYRGLEPAAGAPRYAVLRLPPRAASSLPPRP
jgi:hypothetical protein